jgi:hypothetical protein
LHYRLGWVASPGALPRERFSSLVAKQKSSQSITALDLNRKFAGLRAPLLI